MIQLQDLGWKLMLLSQLLSFVFPVMLAVDPACNYYQTMEVGPSYYVYNREYPNFYGRNQNCFWKAVAPEGYVVEATCHFEMPNTIGCVDERVLISRSGQTNVDNAEVFCGYGNKTLQSDSNIITIGLQTSYAASGGRFICSLQAKATTPPQCDCGWKNLRRIVGGVETKINEYPMMAGLVDLQNKDLFCGATIIANRYAVSAAHCFPGKTPELTALLVGDHNINSGSETDKTSILRISNFIIHAGYNAGTKLNDIAIVKTELVIEFNWAVGPVCLPFYFYQKSFEGETVDVLGWGTTEFTGPSSDVLLETDVNVLSYSNCYNQVEGTIDQLCTYKPGHDACQKDSGGPLLWFEEQAYRLHLVGIVSSGFGCASSKPGLNTRVTSYLQWIMSVTPDASYCVKGPTN